MEGVPRIAAVMTCYNRKESTLRCLESLKRQDYPEEKITIYLLDAASPDGTGAAVKGVYSDVIVINGDSNCFWCGGMRVAYCEAMQYDYDYYLWLNDDTTLLNHAVSHLVSAAKKVERSVGQEGIIVGSTRDPKTGRCTYGGIVSRSRLRPLSYSRREPSGELQECSTMNGNCVLIPRQVAMAVGNLDERFTHGFADFDYGLRARAKGFGVWIAPAYTGECARNPPPKWRDENLTMTKRLQHAHGVKGVSPREWFLYLRRHAGKAWPVYFIVRYIHILLPSLRGGRDHIRG
jgi:GT2 family glycosyltransferase